MLFHVHVKNLALIEQCDLYFHEGLNILTGETGAGKSILIDSIQFALGMRANKDMIRTGAEYAFVELVFVVEEPECVGRLQELEVQTEESQVIISRKIMNNRSISKVNGETVTAARLREISALLLDIHGQHQHQSLFRTEKHLEILDAFAGEKAAALKARIEKDYKEYREVKKRLLSMEIDENARMREIDFHQFEIKEIEEACLLEGEDERLEEIYHKMCNSRNILEGLGEAYNDISSGRISALELISSAVGEVGKIKHLEEELADVYSQLADLEALCEDAAREVESYMSRLEFREEEVRETEERLNQINRLKEKYGKTIEDILEYQEKASRELERFIHMEEEREVCRKQEEDLLGKLGSNADKLTQVRKKEAKKLEKAIVEALQGLNFLNVDFSVVFVKQREVTGNGQDAVEFMISTNPGEEKKPLHKIASGGELSRIMLGIKTILADKDKIEAIIFDEIDTGISGRTAQLAAVKMKEISRSHQVICITHLPQIASMCDYHYYIEKHVEQEKTVTKVRLLEEQESVEELARMLGGEKITKAALENAKEMKRTAKE